MVYDIQNYWGSGPCPSFGIKKPEQDVSETRSVSGLTGLGLALSKGTERVGVFLPSPEDRNRSSFQNVMF
jgi:hypothetical protein